MPTYLALNMLAGNPFSPLNSDYSNHSTPDKIPTPYQDHTIRTPNPFMAELEWEVAKKTYPKLEDVEGSLFTQPTESKEGLGHFPKFWWHSHGQIDDLEANRSSVDKAPPPTARPTISPSVQSSFISTTPPSGASVKLPGSFPHETTPTPTNRPSKKRKLNDSPPPAFYTAYRVPSPLLYHKLSHDFLLNIGDEETPGICLGPSLDDTREEDQPVSDPRAHDSCGHQPSSDVEVEATQPLLRKEYRFVAAALPKMGRAIPSSPVEQAVFCSDP